MDEISVLLDIEYQKYVEKGGKFFLPIYKEKHIDEIIDVSYEMLNEQESWALSTNPYYFQEMETNEPEGLYNF